MILPPSLFSFSQFIFLPPFFPLSLGCHLALLDTLVIPTPYLLPPSPPGHWPRFQCFHWLVHQANDVDCVTPTLIAHTAPATSILPPPTPTGPPCSHSSLHRGQCLNHRRLPLNPLTSTPPPIPGKVVKKIWKAENPDLKDMLSDNIALAKRPPGLPVSTTHWLEVSEVTYPLSCVFFAF